ncbi:MAG: hypothetical protein HFJ06_15145 [Lachnospiraceae bacterium]|nr:hypothetical protein [Lachnospiraceae bacterium]
MKITKNFLKCLVALFVMVITLSLAGITAQAATKTKKLTLYVGEKVNYYYIGLGNLKSVKTNKKAVVAAKKKGRYNQMTAKKAGSATVTVKGTKGTYVYKITVKKEPEIEVKLERRQDKYININVKNKSSAYLDNVYVDISYKNAAGQEVDSKKIYLYYLGAKKQAAKEDCPINSKDVDLSKTTYKVTWSRNMNKDYSDYTKKVKYSLSQSDKYLNIKTSISYKKSCNVFAGYTVYFYDANGNVIGIRDGYNYMSGSNKKYRTCTTQVRIPDQTVRYSLINKRAMLTK